MARTNTIDRYFHPIKQNDAVGQTRGDATTEQDENDSPLFRLPAEIRNLIYHYLWQPDYDFGLRKQPAIMRVNRQLRAEALPLFLATRADLGIETYYPRHWMSIMERIISAFASESAAASSSTLRQTTNLLLSFRANKSTELTIQVEMFDDPKNMDPEPESPYKRVRIGTPGTDWTDAQAVASACDKAVRKLRKDRKEKRDQYALYNRQLQEQYGRQVNGGYVPAATIDHYWMVIDAICRLAKVCPHLTRAVFITDVSLPMWKVDDNRRRHRYRVVVVENGVY